MNVPQLQRRPARPGQLSVFRGRLPVLRSPAHPIFTAHFAAGPNGNPRPLPQRAGAGRGPGPARAGDTAHGEAAGVAGDAARSNPATRIRARIGDDKVDWLYLQNQIASYDIDYLKRFKAVMSKKLRRMENRHAK